MAGDPRAFSSEVDTGSRKENAIKQRLGEFLRFGETRKCSRSSRVLSGATAKIYLVGIASDFSENWSPFFGPMR
jgi:hypothetical protein